MKRVQQHHELMLKIQRHRNVFSNNATRLNRLTETETQESTTGTEAATAVAVATRQSSTNCDDNNIESDESPATC